MYLGCAFGIYCLVSISSYLDGADWIEAVFQGVVMGIGWPIFVLIGILAVIPVGIGGVIRWIKKRLG